MCAFYLTTVRLWLIYHEQGFYLVYDTQLIIGGQHKRMQFDMDDYVLAALSIYLDIINLFILILRLLNDSRR